MYNIFSSITELIRGMMSEKILVKEHLKLLDNVNNLFSRAIKLIRRREREKVLVKENLDLANTCITYSLL